MHFNHSPCIGTKASMLQMLILSIFRERVLMENIINYECLCAGRLLKKNKVGALLAVHFV